MHTDLRAFALTILRHGKLFHKLSVWLSPSHLSGPLIRDVFCDHLIFNGKIILISILLPLFLTLKFFLQSTYHLCFVLDTTTYLNSARHVVGAQ